MLGAAASTLLPGTQESEQSSASVGWLLDRQGVPEASDVQIGADAPEQQGERDGADAPDAPNVEDAVADRDDCLPEASKRIGEC